MGLSVNAVEREHRTSGDDLDQPTPHILVNCDSTSYPYRFVVPCPIVWCLHRTRDIGLGTIVAGFYKIMDDTRKAVRNALIGLLQLMTSWLIIGWVWSILWGYRLWRASKSSDVMLLQDTSLEALV